MSGTLNSGVLFSPKLESFLREERSKESSEVNIIKVKVQGNSLELDSFTNGPIPCGMKGFQDEINSKDPAFYFLRLSKDQWCFVSWVPDGSIKIKERMIYASSKQVLRDGFNAKYIISDHHFTSMSDLRVSGDRLSRLLDNNNSPNTGKNVGMVADRMKNLRVSGEERRALLSKVELAREDAHKQEDVARDEIARDLLAKSGPALSLGSFNSGGFHQVSIPLTESTKEALSRLSNGEISWIEMAVTAKKDGIETLKTFNYDQIPFWERATSLPFNSDNDPRFYITVLGEQHPPVIKKPLKTFSKQSINRQNDIRRSSTLEPKSPGFDSENTDFKERSQTQLSDPIGDKVNRFEEVNDDLKVEDTNEQGENHEALDNEVFQEPEPEPEPEPEVEEKSLIREDLTYLILYSCPPKSPPRLRMVYSTAVGQAISQIQQENIPLNYKIELFEDIPSNYSKFKLLYDKVSSGTGGVFKIDKAPSLSHLVQSSHQQHVKDIQRSKELEALRPRMGRGPAGTLGPHPLFGGVALPSMTGNNPKAE